MRADGAMFGFFSRRPINCLLENIRCQSAQICKSADPFFIQTGASNLKKAIRNPLFNIFAAKLIVYVWSCSFAFIFSNRS